MLYVFLLSTIFAVRCETILDVNDILSSDLMPGSLLLLENPEEYAKDLINTTKQQSKRLDGTFQNAFSTMGFHRWIWLIIFILNRFNPAF